MYLLLNIKDISLIDNVIQVLFKNRYSVFNVAETAESLCPTCQKRGNVFAESSEAEVTKAVLLIVLPNNASVKGLVTILFRNGFPSFVVAETIESLCPRCEGEKRIMDCFNKDVTKENEATPAAETMDESEATVDLRHLLGPSSSNSLVNGCTDSEEINNYSILLSSLLNPKTETPDSAETSDKPDDSCISNILEQSNLFAHLQNSEMDTNSLFGVQNVKKARKPRKRKEAPDGTPVEVDIHECQLCGTRVTFGADVRNFLKCVDRHARLHATKKQYSCIECNAGFTRIDVVKQHISTHHKGMEIRYVDHGFELKDEYAALSDTCFPNVEVIRNSLKRPAVYH